MRSVLTLLFALVGQASLALSPSPAIADFDPPVYLSANEYLSDSSHVAMRPAGDAYVVWARATVGAGATSVVQARKFIAGAGFGATQNLSTVAYAYRPAAAMNSTGTTVVVWTAIIGSDHRIQAIKGSLGDPPFGGVETVSPAGLPPATNPQVAINAHGHALIAWERGGGGILARFRSFSGAYSTVETVVPTGTAFGIKVALATNGSAVVVWTTGGEVRARARSSDGSWGPIKLIGIGLDPDLAMTPAGNALIVWRTGSLVQAVTRSQTGVYSGTVPISDTSLTPGAPNVAMNAKGNALIVWDAGAPQRVYVRSRSAAGALGPIKAITSATGTSFKPQVAINATGDGVIVYYADIDGDSIVRARTRSAAGAFGAQESVSQRGVDSSFGNYPSIAMASDGSAIATWQREVSGWVRIQAAVGGS